ncbi:YIL001W [Saccharomyces arboricola H-6]|uniref:YIL001W n=1 Tax=Saccharomyces arboricola (strain H-6 / AS 2.3317 / CBS 10644) TaxID=1160507 RepID=J8Q6P2_SACAR|nr:YIL001W [Saccharomyces arboricola H-6]
MLSKPMDKNFEELCYSCRTGDMDNVDRLISTGVNVNSVDKFDNSPLFLASLCGHEEVVKLLLQRGAVCDRDRYEGARCIYGALNDAIRDTLLSYDISKAVDVKQPFATHISSIYNEESFFNRDISFRVSNDQLYTAHRFLLCARSTILAGKMAHEWVRNDVILSEVRSDILEIFFKFLYLIPVLHQIEPEQYEELIKLSNEFSIELLPEFLDKARHIADPTDKSRLMSDYQYKFTEVARNQLLVFVNNCIFGSAVDLADKEQLPISLMNCSAYPDILLSVQNRNGSIRIYPCHLAVLSRAEYFKIMFTHNLKEKVEYVKAKHLLGKYGSVIPQLTLPNCEFEVAEIILRYLYADNTDIPWMYAIDVLLVADILLEDRLKTIASTIITQSKEFIQQYNVFDVLYLSWEIGVERLEQFAAKFIAIHLQELYNDPEIKRAIVLSSERISLRQETDTVELVDDIRYYLLRKYSFEPDDVELFENQDDLEYLKQVGYLEYRKDMEIVDDILSRLNLDV